MIRRPPRSTLFPSRRSSDLITIISTLPSAGLGALLLLMAVHVDLSVIADRKSTRLNSSHSQISYAVFCLKKKKNTKKNADHSKLNRKTMTSRQLDNNEVTTV